MITVSPFTGGNVTLHRELETVKYRGEEFRYLRHVYECDDTHRRFTDTEIDEVNVFQVYNQYRAKYGIPFPDEIKSTREKYGLSAPKMSQILGFGTNQYRLYESGEMPSESNGKIMRSIVNPIIFKTFLESSIGQFSTEEYVKIQTKIDKNLEKATVDHHAELVYEYQHRDRLNGFARIDMARLRNILLFFIDRFGGVYNTMMNKLLFYTDFYAYKKRVMAISGLSYKAITFGPVPQRWDRVYSLMDDITTEEVDFDGNFTGNKLVSNVKPDMNVFDEFECGVLEAVAKTFSEATSNTMTKMSHEEKAWLEYKDTRDSIDFREAFYLKAM
jgi:DNA-binding transcriptional regulator YiaG/uncharacterized phage-associated protein